MHVRAPAIVCAARPHGETGVIARVLTEEFGLLAGYVAGGRGRRLRPVLIPGNIVAIDLAARSTSRLPFMKVELIESRGPWLGEPLPAAGIQWVTALTASTLPEHSPYRELYQALSALLDAICHAPSARGWARALVSYESLLLRELGFGAGPARPAGESWEEILAALDVSQGLLASRLLADWRAPVMAARALLRERLGRIEGDS